MNFLSRHSYFRNGKNDLELLPSFNVLHLVKLHQISHKYGNKATQKLRKSIHYSKKNSHYHRLIFIYHLWGAGVK